MAEVGWHLIADDPNGSGDYIRRTWYSMKDDRYMTRSHITTRLEPERA